MARAVFDANILVTGDRTHLPPLREHKGVRIVSLKEFLDEILGSR